MPADFDPIWLLVAVGTLVAAAIGIFAFIIVYLRRTTAPKQDKRAPRQEPQPVREPQPAREPQLVREPVRAPAPDPVDSTPIALPSSPGEVMRVIRDPEAGRIMVEIDGQRYTHIREIRDAQVGRRVLWAVADLLRFTGGMAANPQALKSIPPPEEAAAPQPATEIMAQPRQIEPLSGFEPPPAFERPPLSTPPPPAVSPRPASTPVSEPAPGANVGQTLTSFFRRGFQPAATTTQPSSFIDQIEAILQRRIADLPQPPPFGVHVQSAPDGTLEIEVDRRIYNSPAEVPDPHIRQLIQDAVAEWERR